MDLPNFSDEAIDAARLELACLKENFRYRKFWDDFIRKDQGTGRKFLFLSIKLFDFGLQDGVITGLMNGFYGLRYTGEKALEIREIILSPYVSINSIPAEINRFLPLLFYKPAITQFVNQEYKIQDIEGKKREAHLPLRGECDELWPTDHVPLELKPNQKLLMIDVDKPERQIIEEFNDFLKKAKANKARYREEAWRQLEIWQLRNQGVKFPEIAKRIGLTIDATRKAFYRAFERTQGERYDPKQSRDISTAVFKSGLSISCERCPKRNDCTKICDEVRKFVEQDIIKLREKFLPLPF